MTATLQKTSTDSGIDTFIGNKIKKRRKQLALSQQDLARTLSISYQQVQKYESGTTPITLTRLFQISDALNANANFFLEGAPTANDIGEKIKSEVIVRNRTRPLEVLLVEDNSGDELLFRKAVDMSEDEANVHSINDGEKVIDYLCNSESKYGQKIPDIVLLDIKMPKVDGLEILKQIKKNQSISHIPVIVMTNSVRTLDMERAYKLYATGFILKSTDFDEYVKSIAMLMKYWSTVVILPEMNDN